MIHEREVSIYNSGAVRTNIESAKTLANQAQTSADNAALAASNAQTSANNAATAAAAAQTSANNAATAASNAQTSANNANEYASRALGGLSTVQSVAETLTWITAHGTMALTTDTALDPTHVYFMVDANGDYTVGNTKYSIVAEPDLADIGTYYELTIDESLNNYVGTHLALTNEGLWLIPNSSGGHKILIATGSGTTYTTAGTYIIDGNGDAVAEFSADGVRIGKTDEGNLSLDYHSLILKDKDGDEYIHLSDLRDTTGYATLQEEFSGDGSTSAFTVNSTVSSVESVTIDDVETADYTISYKTFTFTTAPSENVAIMITYKTSDVVRGYTFGSRASGTSLGADSFVSGISCTASGKASYASGYNTVASGTYSTAMGHSTNAIGINSTAIGRGTTARRGNDTALGYQTTASGNYSTAMGANTTASGTYSTAMGSGTTASGNYSTAMGCNTTAAYMSTAMGFQSTASGQYSTAIGRGFANGQYSTAIGDGAIANGISSVSIGTQTKASSESQTAMGKWNVEDTADTYAFILGNGTAHETRSNALTVDWNGNLDIAGGIYIPTNKYISLANDSDYTTLPSANNQKNVIYTDEYGNGMNTYYCAQNYHAFYVGGSGKMYINDDGLQSNVPISAPNGFRSYTQQLAITRVNNSYCNADSISRLTAYKRSGILILCGNLNLSSALPTGTGETQIATVSGWNAITAVSVPAAAIQGSGTIHVTISTSGALKIANLSGSSASAWHRFQIVVPSTS